MYVRCNEARGARQQEQEEQSDVVVTGNTVPSVVPSGVRSSDSQLSSVNVRVDESTQVASMEHGDDNSWNCRPENLLLPGRGNERIVGRTELSSAVYGGARTGTSSSTLGASTPDSSRSSLVSRSVAIILRIASWLYVRNLTICLFARDLMVKMTFYTVMMMMVGQSVHFHGKPLLG